jgi:hypothetical protein
MILGTRTVTNMTLQRADWHRQKADQPKLVGIDASDPAFQVLKSLLGL